MHPVQKKTPTPGDPRARERNATSSTIYHIQDQVYPAGVLQVARYCLSTYLSALHAPAIGKTVRLCDRQVSLMSNGCTIGQPGPFSLAVLNALFHLLRLLALFWKGGRRWIHRAGLDWTALEAAAK